jgi:hypothetical protein
LHPLTGAVAKKVQSEYGNYSSDATCSYRSIDITPERGLRRIIGDPHPFYFYLVRATRIALMEQILARHGEADLASAIVTVKGSRIRFTHASPHS